MKANTKKKSVPIQKARHFFHLPVSIGPNFECLGEYCTDSVNGVTIFSYFYVSVGELCPPTTEEKQVIFFILLFPFINSNDNVFFMSFVFQNRKGIIQLCVNELSIR